MNFHGLLSMLSSILAKARYCEWDEIELTLPFEVITCLDMIETLLQSKLLSLFSSRPSQSKITGYLIYFVGLHYYHGCESNSDDRHVFLGLTWFTHFKNDLSRDLLRILSYVESFSLGWFGFQNVTLPLFPLSEFQFVTVRKKGK